MITKRGFIFCGSYFCEKYSPRYIYTVTTLPLKTKVDFIYFSFSEPYLDTVINDKMKINGVFSM